MTNPKRTLTAPSSCHTVIIGAGLGGLTSACLLAQAGITVSLLEMGPKAGGYLSGYRKNGFQLETAIHWLNQCNNNGLVRRIFNHIGPGSPATTRQEKIRRYQSESISYLLTNAPEQLKNQLIVDFPKEKQGLVKFFKTAQKLGLAYEGLAKFSRNTNHMNLLDKTVIGLKTIPFGLPFIKYLKYDAVQGLDLFFNDPQLKKIFASELRLLSILVPIGWAYIGDFQNPPQGGSHHFPLWLAKQLQKLNGHIYYGHKVKEIICKNGQATGVIWQKGKRRGKILATNIIAACDLDTVYQKMLPPEAISPKFLKRFKQLEIYDSSLMLNIGLTCPANKLGFGQELLSLTKEGVPRLEQNCGDPNRASINIISPSNRDDSVCPVGHGNLIVYMSAKFNQNNNWGLKQDELGQWQRTATYKKTKKKYATILINRIEQALNIDLQSHILFCDVATPFTFQRYSGNKDGTIMAQKPEPANYRLRVTSTKSPIKNLFISGHWADYGGGVPIAVKSGANCVLPILKRENKAAYKKLCQTLDSKN